MELKRILKGSTLVETLVMMFVAGIVFLFVMDGFALFVRLQTRRAAALQASGRQTEGYFRLGALTAEADSIRPAEAERWIAYRRGRDAAELSLADSVLVYRAGGFRDTLLTGVRSLRLIVNKAEADTLEIGFGTGLTVRFAAARPAAEQYRAALEEIEKGYGYQE